MTAVQQFTVQRREKTIRYTCAESHAHDETNSANEIPAEIRFVNVPPKL